MAKISLQRKSIFILVLTILSLGSAVFHADRQIVEPKFIIMINRSAISQAFQRDPLCGLFSTVDNRQMKCQEVLNSNDFKSKNSEIIYDAERANLCEKCKTYEVILSTAKSLSDRKIFMKMFPCPFKQNNESGQGLYYISLGSDSDTVFLYTDLQPYKLPVGWYWSQPFQGNN